MSVNLGSAGGDGSGVTVDDIAALQSQIDAITSTQNTNPLDSDPDVEQVGAQLQGGTLPAGSAVLLPTGNGNKKRWVSATVAADNTKRAAWAAQSAATPYALPLITSTSRPAAATAGSSFTVDHTATVDLGAGDLVWSIVSGGTDSTHVAGGTLNTATGVLTGTAGAAATYIYVVQAVDEVGGVAQQIVVLPVSVAATPTFAVPGVPPVQPSVGNAFSWDILPYAVNFTGTPTITVISGLPANHLSFSGHTVSGTPLAADYGASFTVVFQATDGTNTKTASVTFTIPAASLAITTTNLGSLQQSQVMTPVFIATSGGAGTKSYAASGSVPAGVALAASAVSTSGIAATASSSTLTKTGHGYVSGQPLLSGANIAGLPQIAVYIVTRLTANTFTLASIVDGTVFTATASDANMTLATIAGSVYGMPTSTGAYSGYVITVTDQTTPTPQTASQTFSGTIAPAAQAFSWFDGAASYDLTADAGNPKVGDAVDIDMSRYEANGGTVTYSGVGVPSFGLDVITGHYKGTTNKAGTANPVLRASNDGGSTWKSTQCHLTILSAVTRVDIAAAITAAGGTLGDGLTGASGRTTGATNLSAIISAIAQAKSSGYGLKSTSGTDAAPVYIGISRASYSASAYIESGSATTAGVSLWDLGNVILYLVPGQPTNATECIILRIWNVTNGTFIICTDARGGSQPAPPAAGSGAAGFYNNGQMFMQCVNPQGVVQAHNNVGVTGSSSGGTNETFDIKFGKHGGGGDLECHYEGQWQGDTGTHYASGLVNQQTPVPTGGFQASDRLKVKAIANKRRHYVGEYGGGPMQIAAGSTGSNCARGLFIEDGVPTGGAIRSPSMWVGEPGQPGNPVVTTNCSIAGVGSTSSGGGQVGEIIVYAHTSIGDDKGYYQNCAALFTIAHSKVQSPGEGHCIGVAAGGGKTQAQNAAAVSVDTATCTKVSVTGSVVSPNTATLGAGTWT